MKELARSFSNCPFCHSKRLIVDHIPAQVKYACGTWHDKQTNVYHKGC